MQKIIFFTILTFFSFKLNAQLINEPNYGQKSHETLKIERIETNADYTVISLSIVNKIANGEFCADKNIYLKNSLGSEMYQIIKKEGIPECPKTHKFKQMNEKLNFKLYFPPIDKNIKYIDLVENCEDACFSFRGIILSGVLNRQIDKAYLYYQVKQLEKSALEFETIIKQTADYPYAFLYFSAIRIWNEAGNTAKAEQLKRSLKASDKIDKNVLN